MNVIDQNTRRGFLRTILAAKCLSFTAPAAEIPAAQSKPDLSAKDDRLPTGNESIVILIYPGFTALDAFGPEYILSCMMGASVRFIAKTADPVRTESGIEVSPHLTFAQLPQELSLFLVPGGTKGTLEAIQDPATRDFVRKAGRRSASVGSVCTGSLLLGASGLLTGYEATSHWQMMELLPIFGAKPINKRVVFDRNRATAAGVTAGLDFALELVRRYRGDFYAEGVQLLGQYDPQPPFSGGGDPRSADPRLVRLLTEMHKPFIGQFETSIRKAQLEG